MILATTCGCCRAPVAHGMVARGPVRGAVRGDIDAYLITQTRGMAARKVQQAPHATEELRRVIGFSIADEIEKLDRLKKTGSLSDLEFSRLRARLVQ